MNFGFGLAKCVLIFSIAHCVGSGDSLDRRDADQESKTSEAVAPKGFTLIRMSNGVKTDGAPFSSNLYQSVADKAKVWLSFVHYHTAEDVDRAFDEEVKNATRIVEKENLLDRDGHIEGRRAVLVFDAEDKKPAFAMIEMTYGNQLRDIRSFSLDVALEFEKQAHATARERKHAP